MLSLSLLVSNAAAVCAPATATEATSGAWPFSTEPGHAYSCASSAGGTNDLGTAPQQCAGDPASVRIEVSPGKAECLVASAAECKIPMHDFVSLDYDFHISACNGIWAAPLWMTPDTWQWGAGSGEIDSLEFCPRDSVNMNFAGGGHQVPATGFSIDGSDGHVTVRKDTAGIVTIVTCTSAVAAKNGGQCVRPSYSGCPGCLDGANAFGCWCNAPENIYGSGGCKNGGDCQWTLVSDVWNGVGGDAGYAGCMTAVPALDLLKGKPNLNSKCALSVEHIVLRGGGKNQSLQWGAGSPASCAALTTAPPTPQPAPVPPAPVPPAPTPARYSCEGFSCQEDPKGNFANATSCRMACAPFPGPPPPPPPPPPSPSGGCAACTVDQCSTEHCGSASPFVCVAGAAAGGCSADSKVWPASSSCSSCCDASAC